MILDYFITLPILRQSKSHCRLEIILIEMLNSNDFFFIKLFFILNYCKRFILRIFNVPGISSVNLYMILNILKIYEILILLVPLENNVIMNLLFHLDNLIVVTTKSQYHNNHYFVYQYKHLLILQYFFIKYFNHF